MTKVELARMVTFIVREELKKQLPVMIERVLTEQYLRRVVTEQTRSRRVAESPEYEDEIPEPEENEHDGIYHEDSPMLSLRQPTNEAVRKLLSPENPFAGLYEGVKPIGTAPAQPEVGLGDLKKLGVDFDKMRQAAGIAPKQVEPIREAPRRHRPEWDRVVDTRTDRTSEPQRQRLVESPRPVSPFAAESAAFPDAPISFDE